MPQPINYLRPSQGAGFAQSLMQGINLGQQAKQRAMQTSVMEEKQNMAKAEVQRKTLGREAIKSLIDSGETDPVKWAEIDALYPEFKDGGKRIAAALNLKKDKNTENLLLRTRNAVDVGNYDAAGKMFYNYAKAYESKPDVAAMYQEMGDAFVDLNENPKGLEKAIGMLDRLGVSVLDEKYFLAKKTKSDIRGVDAESRLKEAQAGVVVEDATSRATSAKAAIGKVKNDAKKLVIEAQKYKNEQGGVLTPTQQTDYKIKLQNQYRINGGEEFRKINRGYRNIENADMTGVGGLNILFHFMKQIDPTSVVSPGEQATATAASGKLSSIAQLWNKWFDKGQMSEEAIKQFKSQAKKLMKNAKKDDDKLRAIIINQAKPLKLDIKGILGVSNEEQARREEKYSWTKDANKPTNNTIGGGVTDLSGGGVTDLSGGGGLDLSDEDFVNSL